MRRSEQRQFLTVWKRLTFLARFISLVVFPSYRLVALFAYDVPHNVSPCCHISLHRFTLFDVDDIGEEERLSMLATEVS